MRPIKNETAATTHAIPCAPSLIFWGKIPLPRPAIRTAETAIPKNGEILLAVLMVSGIFARMFILGRNVRLDGNLGAVYLSGARRVPHLADAITISRISRPWALAWESAARSSCAGMGRVMVGMGDELPDSMLDEEGGQAESLHKTCKMIAKRRQKCNMS